MKGKRILLMAAIAGTMTWSCKSFEGASVTATPDPLEVHGGEIKFDVKVNIPPKSGMKKNGVYNGNLVIKNGGKDFAINKISMSSPDKKKLKKQGLDTSATFTTAYVEGMNGGDLTAVNSYTRKGKTFDLPELKLAQCCILTSQYVYENLQVLTATHNYQKSVPMSLSAQFNFPKNIWEIDTTQYDKSDIKAIGDFIKKKYKFTSVNLQGFASPEGPYKRNVMLATNRLEEAKQWLIGQLKDAGYEQYLDSNFFQVSTTSADWEGFKSGLSGMGYDQDKISQITTIVSSGVDEDTKEHKIMAIVGGKDQVESILAPLRKATVFVNGYEPKRTDAQIDQIAKDFADGKKISLKDSFEVEEWYYAITRMEDVEGKKKLLKAFTEAHPTDYRGWNDLGAFELSTGNVAAAMQALQKADQVKPGDYMVKNNLGMAYYKQGNMDAAKTALEASLASRSTAQASFMLGVLAEKEGDYQTASDKFGAATSLKGGNYNLGLVKLLMGDLNGAKSSLEAATSQYKDEALFNYTLAIVGARLNDVNLMTLNLKEACTKDSAYKTKAKSDLEFRKYFKSPEFQAATE